MRSAAEVRDRLAEMEKAWRESIRVRSFRGLGLKVEIRALRWVLEGEPSAPKEENR